MTDTITDVRWKQRFNNYIRFFRELKGVVEDREHYPDFIKQAAMVRYFEISNRLGVSVLKDYLRYQGVQVEDLPKKIIRESFSRDLIKDGQAWMDMLEGMEKASHIYDTKIARELTKDIDERFYPAFAALAKDFTKRYEKEE